MIKKVLVLFGTRPEAIKLAPVIMALKKQHKKIQCIICSTGQHQTMVEQVLPVFDIKIDLQLNAMRGNKNLAILTSTLFKDIDQLLEEVQPDWILVQGDTTSAYVGAMCAYYRKIKIGHVEAGLRTYDRWSPFPEEINRQFISGIADVHFTPTSLATKNVKKECKARATIVETGNTVVDALDYVTRRLKKTPAQHFENLKPLTGKKMILVTCHRRESFGEGLENICKALLQVAAARKDIQIIFPVHLNPNVKLIVEKLLNTTGNIKLIPPQPYLQMIYLMQKSYLILSDSGGIQEEAPSFKKPLIILRNTTERPEVLKAGCAILAGTDINTIVKQTLKLLNDKKYYNSFIKRKNPFGDGKAAGRIIDHLINAKQ